ncbi:MAG: LysR family transcriptional regulator [Oscillospiraceae bacterium]|nr:LysR family transcriptional regulator [Oscillospiraceae bacterium]
MNDHEYLDLDTKALLCFKKVAELEHITKASQQLYISQAQLSKIITDLENQFGVKFFDRVGKGIQLNSCGRLFYQYAVQILDTVYKAEKKLQEVYLHEQVEITISTNASSYIPALIGQLKQRSENLRFRQMTLTQRKSLQYLKEGTVDFALCIPMLDDPELTTVFLRKEPGILIYPEGHWLSAYQHVSLSMLKDEDMIGLAKGFSIRDATETPFKKYKFEPNYVMEVSDAHMIAQCVNQGLGIAIVPRSTFIRSRDFKFRHVEIDEPLSGAIGLSYVKTRELSETDKLVIETFIAYFDALNAMD